jgi:hypothetical protein
MLHLHELSQLITNIILIFQTVNIADSKCYFAVLVHIHDKIEELCFFAFWSGWCFDLVLVSFDIVIIIKFNYVSKLLVHLIDFLLLLHNIKMSYTFYRSFLWRINLRKLSIFISMWKVMLLLFEILV